MTNRTKQKTTELLSFFKNRNKDINFELIDWDGLAPGSDVDLIINTTSFGMKENECLKIDTINLKDRLIFVDIIYSPKETELLKLFKKSHYFNNILVISFYSSTYHRIDKFLCGSV